MATTRYKKFRAVFVQKAKQSLLAEDEMIKIDILMGKHHNSSFRSIPTK
jgi:hypothetical protein